MNILKSNKASVVVIVITTIITLAIIAGGVYWFLIREEKESKTLNIQDIKMTIPDKWEIDKQTENQAYIKTDYQPYNVFLVLDVHKNPQGYNLEEYKKEHLAGDYTEIKDGKIFGEACGGALACHGAIIDDDVYTFGWTVESDQPVPKDLDGIWGPDHNVTQEDIWNILLSIEK